MVASPEEKILQCLVCGENFNGDKKYCVNDTILQIFLINHHYTTDIYVLCASCLVETWYANGLQQTKNHWET